MFVFALVSIVRIYSHFHYLYFGLYCLSTDANVTAKKLEEDVVVLQLPVLEGLKVRSIYAIRASLL